MGTAERYGAQGTGAATIAEGKRGPQVPGREIPADVATEAPSEKAADVPALGTAARAARVTESGAGAPAAEARAARVADAGRKPVAGAGAEADLAFDAGSGLAAKTAERFVAEPEDLAESEGQGYYRPLWVEEPADRRRLPDPVRTAAVRAVIIIAVTLIQAMVAFLCTLAGSWLAFPMVLSSVASTVVATWGALDVWVTRQVWNQRNGVVSEPSSTARALRRERRKARRQERTAERAKERIRRRGGGTGQLSHS
jgi:hypothetical protein